MQLVGRIEALLLHGLLPMSELMRQLGVSQSTLSRALRSKNVRIITLGKGRATRYGMRRGLSGSNANIPVYLVSEKGRVSHIADLVPLMPKGIYVISRASNVSNAFYDDLPYWMEDLRPSGFLGRLIARKLPTFGYSEDPRLWSVDTVLHYLVNYGWDLIGNLIIGEGAYQEYLKQKIASPSNVGDNRIEDYARLADEVINFGDAGSSAGGEQPKFLARYPDSEISNRSLVKFRVRGSDPVSKRREEMLILEHLALETLNGCRINAAKSKLYFDERRVYLDLLRFDRHRSGGRTGMISLHALNAHFTAADGTWREMARALHEKKIISESDYREILWRYYFGQCIGNVDMHAWNLSFFIEGEKILGLAPVYDMLPMIVGPVNDELRSLSVVQPVLFPNDAAIWKTVIPVAIDFWNMVIDEPRIGAPVKEFARRSYNFLTSSI